MESAKLFWSGRSQAVRLPKEYRFDGTEVRIRRHGNGVILEPVPAGWAWLADVQGPLDADFEATSSQDLPQQERPGLQDIFE
jgi:antitoxin VapB